MDCIKFRKRSNASASTIVGNTGGKNYIQYIESTIQNIIGWICYLKDKSTDNLGWWHIIDNSSTVENPQIILANNRTKISINKDFIIDGYAPKGLSVSDIFDQNKIKPIQVGDSYIFRLSMVVDPTLNNRNLTLDLDIGGTQNIVWERTTRLARGAGVPTKISMTNSVFALNTFVENGGELYITCDGDIEIYSVSLFIQKVTSA